MGVRSRLCCAVVRGCSCSVFGVGLLEVGVEQVGIGFGLKQGSAWDELKTGSGRIMVAGLFFLC